MAWLVIAKDSKKGAEIRADADAMAAMWAFELQLREIILLAGSLRDDDKTTKTGSVFLFDVDTRAEVEALLDKDPSTHNGLRDKVDIQWLNVAILDRVVQD